MKATAKFERPMQTILRALPLFALVLLAGCASSGSMNSNLGPTLAQPGPVATAPVLTGPAPSDSIKVAQAGTDVTNFLDPAAARLLTAAGRDQASAAQFNALQFGRPGAPRAWSDGGTTGSVVVGPPVNVNSLYCRDFTHTVTASGQTYTRKGLACRELDGTWKVEQG
jgi:surface antigen